ncbi:MAG: site-2 protease family protein [Treponema sp.]|jgi:regulator of sigma E protease|nr:site-2 protease family protein [Treponema sp.]
MLIMKILIGLLGLGVVVFVHELGHFLAARLVGIEVEAFSIGWGNPILKKKIGSVEYRIGMFPLGGYCKMRGENEFQEAYEQRRQAIAPVKGTYFGVSPWRRITVSFAGPFFNLIFAVLALSVIWGLGFEVTTLENRIVLASSINPKERYPADEGNLKTGDRITHINDRPTATYQDIQEMIAVNPEKDLSLTVEREGTLLPLKVRPQLDKRTGAGKIGVYFWADPVVASVSPGSSAAIGGIQKGDRILKINGTDIPYTVALLSIIRTQPPILSVEFERAGQLMDTELVLSYTEDGGTELGINYQTIHYRTPRLSPLGALIKGTEEAWKTFVLSFRSFALLFRGIDLTQAVSGPVRITYMVGDVATAGFGESVSTGLRSMASFLSLISIALCIMNLLPLPILDGGMILLFIIEGIKRKPLPPRAIYVFQTVGVVLIVGLMAFAVFGDILYLVHR